MPTSIIDELLGEGAKSPAKEVKKAAPRLPDLQAQPYNRANITGDLAGLLAFAEEMEAAAQQAVSEGLSGDSFARKTRPLSESAVKVRQALQFFHTLGAEKTFRLRETDQEVITLIADVCDRTEFLLFQKKLHAQMIPRLQDVTDEWTKKILNVPHEIDFRLNTPVFVYEVADLREINKRVPIFKGFEHNRVFTGVFRDKWDGLAESEKVRMIKDLVRIMGKRMHKVRLVDDTGRLLGECRSRTIDVY